MPGNASYGWPSADSPRFPRGSSLGGARAAPIVGHSPTGIALFVFLQRNATHGPRVRLGLPPVMGATGSFFLATTPLRSLGVVDLFGKTRTFRNISHVGFNYKNFLAMQFRGLILRESGQAANSLPSRDL